MDSNKNHLNKKLFFWGLTGILIVLSVLFGAEIVLRIYNLASGRLRHIWIPDPVIGYRHTSNNKFVNTVDEPDKVIKNEFTTNSLGILHEEVVVQKPADVIRVIVLGDSYTESLQVPQDKDFSSRLEEYLNQQSQNAASGKRFEVLNAGVSGFSPISEYLYYISELARLQPDLVIQQIYANDVHNDNEATVMSVLDSDGLPVKINRYFFEDMYNKRLAQGDRWEESRWRGIQKFLIDHSRFIEYVYIRIEKSHKRSNFQKKMKVLPEYSHHNYFFIVQPGNVLFKDTDFRDKAVGLTQKYILALRDEVKNQGAEFLAFYIPLHEQIPTTEQREEFYFSQPANNYLNEFLVEFSKLNKISFIDMYPILSKYPMEECFLRRDSHLTEKGHEIVAKAILEELGQKGMVTRLLAK
jgi:lysophospholipase L1-like esterase